MGGALRDFVTDAGRPIWFSPLIGAGPRAIRGTKAMTKNVGGLDQMARIAAGVVLIALTLFGVVGWWGWIGVVPLATGLMGWCPFYPLLGLNSCPRKA